MHVIQVNSKGEEHHPFASDLFNIFGSQGLSWIPISISINDSHLQNKDEPFIVIIRATRGNGPEADIALDHISILEGNCFKKLKYNPDILTKPATSVENMYIYSLKYGPSFTPYISLADSSASTEKQASNRDLCNALTTCSDCVSSFTQDCLWCSSTHSCAHELSLESRKCHESEIIRNALVSNFKNYNNVYYNCRKDLYTHFAVKN